MDDPDDPPVDSGDAPLVPPTGVASGAAAAVPGRTVIPAEPAGGGIHIGPWPFGIIAVFALRVVNAVGLILLGLGRSGLPIGGVPIVAGSGDFTRLLDLAFGILIIVGLVGLLMFRRWGWILTMVLVGISLGGDLIRVWIGQPAYGELLLHVLAAFYLNGRSVRALAAEDFEHGSAGDERMHG